VQRLPPRDHGGGHVDGINAVVALRQPAREFTSPRTGIENRAVFIRDQVQQDIEDLWRVGKAQVIEIDNAPILETSRVRGRQVSGFRRRSV